MREALLKWDHDALDAVRRWRTPARTTAFTLLTHLGAPSAFALLAGGLWWWGSPLTMTLLRRLSAAGAAWGIVELVKRVARRRRPDVARPEHRALISNPDAHSFPSGHTATTVAAATAMAGVQPAVTITAVLLAPLISFSRVYLGVHFPLDVLAGAAIGVACGLAVPPLLGS